MREPSQDAREKEHGGLDIRAICEPNARLARSHRCQSNSRSIMRACGASTRRTVRVRQMEQGRSARQVRCEPPLLEHLSLVRNGADCGTQQGLSDHGIAQRCLRMPRWWARSVELHLGRGTHLAQSGHGRRVKTHRAFDAPSGSFCQPLAAASTTDMPGGSRCRRGVRARAQLEASIGRRLHPPPHMRALGSQEHRI